MIKRYKGFTLAETMTVIAIIGVIAAITLPSTMRRHTETVNRTKVKNAMKLYSDVINRVVLDYNLYNNTKLGQWAATEGTTNCSKSNVYFRYIDGSNCKFKTDDGVWWNISNIESPIIILDETLKNENLETIKSYAEDRDNNKVFYLLGHFDEDSNLRVNDSGYEISKTNNKINIDKMIKLYGFLDIPLYPNYSKQMKCDSKTNKCTLSNYHESSVRNPFHVEGTFSKCDLNGENCSSSNIYELDENGNQIYQHWGCDGSGNNCQKIQYYEYDENGNRTYGGYCNLNKQNCNKEFIFETDDNHNITSWYFGCSSNKISSCKYYYKYEYDERGNVIKYIATWENYMQKFEYDKYGNITQYYQCDKNGNNCYGPNTVSYEY